MPARLLSIAVLVAAAAVGPAASASAAAGCPTGFTAVTAKQVYADVKRLPQAQADGVTLAVVEGVLAAVDRNGDGRVCRQDDSTGRAPGQPSYYSNFVDNVLR